MMRLILTLTSRGHVTDLSELCPILSLQACWDARIHEQPGRAICGRGGYIRGGGGTRAWHFFFKWGRQGFAGEKVDVRRASAA